MNDLIAGIIALDINGRRYLCSGDFNYNEGHNKREALLGVDKQHGYSEKPQVAFIEGEIRNEASLKLADLVTMKNASITLTLPMKTVIGSFMYFCEDGTVDTGEGKISVRWEGVVEEI